MMDTPGSTQDIAIPGIVLPGTTIPDPLPYDHDAWGAWYQRTLAHRVTVARQCSQPGLAGIRARAAHRALCTLPFGIGHLYWLNTFCFISEPRDDGSSVMPFITWHVQAKLILELHAMMATPYPDPRASMAVEKTRACGATWIDSSHNVWEWTFGDYFTAILIGKTLEDVDRPGDPDSWFWKHDFLLGRHLEHAGNRYPKWLLPKGFDWDTAPGTHRKNNFLSNPETQSKLTGEATTPDAGRGGRSRKVSIDEGQRNAFMGTIWSSIAQVTGHRVVYGTAGLRPPDFHDIVYGKNGYTKPRTIRIESRMIPGRDDEWHRLTRESMSDERYRVEVLIDYKADQSTREVYPDAANIPVGWYPYEPGDGPVYVSIDDGLYPDPTAILIFQDVTGSEHINLVGAYKNVSRVIDFYGAILSGDIHGPHTRNMTRRDEQMAAWCKEIGLSKIARFYGDRHGDQNNQVTGTSPFHHLYTEYGIYVNVTTSPEMNSIQTRREKTAALIPWLRVHEANGAPEALDAFINNKLPEAGKARTMATTSAIHDDTSHFTTALEYLAIHRPTRGTARRETTVERNITNRRRPDRPVGRFTGRHAARP